MNPNGRPKLKPRERRNALSILVRFNQEEARRINRTVREADKLPAQWARERLLAEAP